MQITKDPKYFKTIFGKFLLCFSSTANVIIFITAKLKILIKRRSNERTNSSNVIQLYFYEKMYEVLKRSYLRSKVHRLDTSNKNTIQSLSELIATIGK
jgi:hypothetical protein